MTADKIKQWFDGNCTSDEQAEMERWFIENINSPLLDDTLRECLSGCNNDFDREHIRKAFHRTCHRLGIKPATRRWKKYFYTALQSAAVVAIAIMLWMQFNTSTQTATVTTDSEWNEIYASRGETKTVLLPDSSKIRLSPASALIYNAKSFANHREVFLYGGAYAEVAKKSNSTNFTIRCDHASIRVLGTKFTVNSYAEDNEMEVILYEGGVELASSFAGINDTIRLRPGNIAKIDKISGDSFLLDANGAEFNENCEFYFLDKKFSDICNDLERHFCTNIIVQNHGLASRKFYAIFANGESLDQILEALDASGDMKITHYGNHTIEIK
jgi:ferric-dicitrate binding protein FerR (iron transport regulator)